jgi:hypothetical protein
MQETQMVPLNDRLYIYLEICRRGSKGWGEVRGRRGGGGKGNKGRGEMRGSIVRKD